MNAEAESTASSMDTVKLGLSLLILVAGILGFYQFAEVSLLLRVIGLLAVAGVAVWIALQSAQGRTVWAFAVESRTEVRRVVWPSRQETLQTTLIVFVMVLLLGIFLWLVDMLLAYILKVITG